MLFTRNSFKVSTNEVTNISYFSLINTVNWYPGSRLREQQKCKNGRRDYRLQEEQLLLCFPILNQVLAQVLNTIGNFAISQISNTSKYHILEVMTAELPCTNLQVRVQLGKIQNLFIPLVSKTLFSVVGSDVS